MHTESITICYGYKQGYKKKQRKEVIQHNLRIYHEELQKRKTNKTHTVMKAVAEKKHNIIIERRIPQQVRSYNYLGTIIKESGKIENEINAGI